MKKSIILLLITSILLVGCGGEEIKEDTDKIKVSVAILPLKDFVEKVGGEYVDVAVAIPKGASPANYEPKPTEIKTLVDSEVYFSIGVPTEKGNILPKLSDEKIEVVHLADLVDEKYDARFFDDEHEDEEENNEEEGHEHEGHKHEGRDPHIWVSPKRAAYMVELIAEKLSAVKPEHKEVFEKNAKEFIEKINEKDESFKKEFDGKELSFIVFHPSLGYFADDYGLEMISIEQDGKRANANHLKEVIDLGREKNITNVLYQEEFFNQSAKQIASDLGGEASPYTVLWEDYLKGLDNLKEIFSE